MRAYLQRYMSDVGTFGKAFGLATIAVLPVTIFLAGSYFWLVYGFFAVLGLPTIMVVGLMSAIATNYSWKLFTYLIAVLALGFLLGWGPVELQHLYSWEWMKPYSMLFFQVVFLMAIFYCLIERAKISSWLRAL